MSVRAGYRSAVTPMIVCVRWSNVTVDPIARGSEPNCRRQYASLITDRIGRACLLFLGREQTSGPCGRAEHRK